MFELAAALALVYTIIFGVTKGYHKEGGGGVVAFLAMYVIAFIVIAATIAVFEYVAGQKLLGRHGPICSNPIIQTMSFGSERLLFPKAVVQTA